MMDGFLPVFGGQVGLWTWRALGTGAGAAVAWALDWFSGS